MIVLEKPIFPIGRITVTCSITVNLLVKLLSKISHFYLLYFQEMYHCFGENMASWALFLHTMWQTVWGRWFSWKRWQTLLQRWLFGDVCSQVCWLQQAYYRKLYICNEQSVASWMFRMSGKIYVFISLFDTLRKSCLFVCMVSDSEKESLMVG